MATGPPVAGAVLHVLKYYRPDFSGEAVFLERSAAVLACLARGVSHDLLVTTTPCPDVLPTTCSALRRICYLTRRRRATWIEELRLVGWMAMRVTRYDTVHFRTHADWYFLSYAIVRMAGRRLVLSATLDDSVPALVDRYRPALRPIARRLFGLFHEFITLNAKLQAENARLVDPGRCHLLPVGVLLPPERTDAAARRAAMRARFGVPPAAFVMVSVGGLCARKDPAFLVDRMPVLRQMLPNIVLLLVGPELEPAYVAPLRLAASRSEGHVRLIGEVADAADWYDVADVMVFASRLEGFGTVVTEGMAHGLPVVARRLPQVNEGFVIDDVTGFAFDDAAGFVAAVQRLATDPIARRRMAACGRRLVAEQYDLTRIAESYLRIYGFAVDPDAEAPRSDDPAAMEETRQGWSSLLRIGATASLVQPRFQLPAEIDTDVPLLITMIDAEEAFDWNGGFSRDRTDVSSMASQGAAHRIFDRYGVVPIYAVDQPVVSQDAGCAPLIEYLADGRCDIGAQLHGWVTPPFEEEVTRRNSFACNLPARLQYEKLRHLTDSIGEALGVQPRVHRSGRYGIGPNSANILHRLGYLMDSSVVPHWSYAAEGGPDFRRFPAAPYWADAQRTLLEIPLTAAFCGRLGGQFPGRRMLADAVFGRVGTATGVASLAVRSGMLERIKLTPEGVTIEEMKRLTAVLAARGRRVFMLTYHTPSLQPGNTPYVRTPADAERFLARLDEFYAWFTTELRGRPARWQDVYAAARNVDEAAPERSPASRASHVA